MLEIIKNIAGEIADVIKDVINFIAMIFDFIISSFDIFPDDLKIIFLIIFSLLSVLLIWRFFK